MALIAPSSFVAGGISPSAIELFWHNESSYTGIIIERSDGGWHEVGHVGIDNENFIDASCQDGTTYTYRLQATDGYNTVTSAEASGTSWLAAPSGLGGTANDTEVYLTWQDNCQNESGFKIYKGGVYLATVAANITLYTATGLTPGVWYDFFVVAYNGVATSPPSNTLQILTADPPAQPSNLTGGSVTSSTARLNWKDNASNEIDFHVERSATSATAGFAEIGTTDPNVVTYGDTGLASNTAYWYRVRAHNASGYSAYSNVLAIVTLAAIAQPTGLEVLPFSGIKMDVRFVDNSDEEDHHSLERKLAVPTFTIAASNKLIYFANQADQKVVNGNLETWTSATVPGTWAVSIAGTSTVNRDASPYSGTYCLRSDVDASDNHARLYQDITLVADAEYIFSCWYKTAAGKTASLRLFDVTENQCLSLAGSWVAGPVGLALAAATVWTNIKIKFTMSANTSLQVLCGHSNDMGSAASSSVYFDDVYLCPKLTATLTEGAYNTTTLAAEIVSKMDAQSIGNATVTYNTGTDKFTFASDALQYLYLTLTTNALWATIAFPTLADADFALSYLGGAVISWAEIKQMEPNRTFYRDSGLTTGIEYVYRVRAKQGAVYSDYSAEVAETTLVVPAKLTYAGLRDYQDTWIEMIWYGPMTETGFKIERSIDAGANYTEIAIIPQGVRDRTPGSSKSYYIFRDTGLTPNTAYTYRARAYNGSGNGAYEIITGLPVGVTTRAKYLSSKFEKLIKQSKPNLIFLVEVNPLMELKGFALTGGKTYTYEMAFDELGSELDFVYQNGEALREQADITNTEAMAGSWYQDRCAGMVYVHTLDGDNPGEHLITGSFWLYFTNWQDGETIFNDNFYYPLVAADGIPDIGQEMQEYQGDNLIVTTGQVSFINGQVRKAPFFDRISERYIWTNRKAKILAGGIGFTYSEFRAINTGSINASSITDQRFALDLRDYRDGLQRNLPAEKFALTEFPNLSSSAENYVRPFGFGTITNAVPVQFDTVNRRFEFHNGLCKSVTQITQNGIALTEDVDFFVDYGQGQFVLARALAYNSDDIMLIDFHGWTNNADEEINNPAEIFKKVMNYYLGVSDTDLNLQSIYETKYICTTALSLYVWKELDSGEIIRRIEQSTRANSYQDADGSIGIRPIQTMAPSNIKYIPSEWVLEFGKTITQEALFSAIEYSYNEDPSADKFDLLIKTNVNATRKYGVNKTLAITVALASSSDVDTLAAAVMADLEKFPFEFVVPRVLFDNLQGDLIYFNRSRFPGLSGTANNLLIRILKINKRYSSGRTSITARKV